MAPGRPFYGTVISPGAVLVQSNIVLRLTQPDDEIARQNNKPERDCFVYQKQSRARSLSENSPADAV
jgi:hypothetical protein